MVMFASYLLHWDAYWTAFCDTARTRCVLGISLPSHRQTTVSIYSPDTAHHSLKSRSSPRNHHNSAPPPPLFCCSHTVQSRMEERCRLLPKVLSGQTAMEREKTTVKNKQNIPFYRLQVCSSTSGSGPCKNRGTVHWFRPTPASTVLQAPEGEK